MTSEAMHELFDIIQDKYNAAYFIQDEKDVLLNDSQTRFINNIIFKEILGRSDIPKGPQSLYDIESDIKTSTILQPLTIIDEAATPAADKISLTGLANTPMHVIGVRSGSVDSLVVKFVRQQNIGKYYGNVFKAPSSTKVYYSIGVDNLYIYPSSSGIGGTVISYIKYPATIVYAAKDCELPDFTHTKIVANALELAGIATFDEAMSAIAEV